MLGMMEAEPERDLDLRLTLGWRWWTRKTQTLNQIFVNFEHLLRAALTG